MAQKLYLLLFRSEKQVITVQAENKKLVEPLKKAKEELHRLKGIFYPRVSNAYTEFVFLETIKQFFVSILKTNSNETQIFVHIFKNCKRLLKIENLRQKITIFTIAKSINPVEMVHRRKFSKLFHLSNDDLLFSYTCLQHLQNAST